MNIRYNKEYSIFLIFFYAFVFKDLFEKYIYFFGYIDELVALLAIPFFIIISVKNGGILKVSKVSVLLLFFYISGILGNIIYQYQPFLKAALPDLFLCMKFWLSIYVGQNLFSHLDLKKYSNSIYFHLKLIIYLYYFLLIIDNLFYIFPGETRYGFRTTRLFYLHPTIFAAVCVFLIAVLFAIRPYVKNTMIHFLMLLFLMCTTFRSKTFGAALVFLVIFYLVGVKRKKIRFRTVLLMIPIVIIIGWNQIEYYFFSSIQYDSARYQIASKSLEVAIDHFPIGSGFGTFGSFVSGEIYSPLYYMYGLSNVFGMKKGEAYFISDSFWPMIFGQTGFIGLILWIIALAGLYYEIQKIKLINLSWYMSGLFILSYLMISSIAEAAFVHSLAVPLGLWVGLLLKKNKYTDYIVD